MAIVNYTGKSNKFKLLEKYTLSPSGVKGKPFLKIINAYELFEKIISMKSSMIDLVVFEDYAFAGNGQITRIAELVGMVKLLLVKKDIPFATMPIKSAKKIIHGDAKSTTTKEDVQASLAKFLENYDSIEWNNTDESDAASVAIGFWLKELEGNIDG